jgi:hypothetical protein
VRVELSVLVRMQRISRSGANDSNRGVICPEHTEGSALKSLLRTFQDIEGHDIGMVNPIIVVGRANTDALIIFN